MSLSNHLEKANRKLGIEKLASAIETRSPAPSCKQEFEKLALLVAQTWKDDHPSVMPTLEADMPEADIEDCIAYVTTEMAAAATAVGGIAGLEILTGGGSAAACVACKQVLSVQNLRSES